MPDSRDDVPFAQAVAFAGACSVLSELLCTPLEADAIVDLRQGPFLGVLDEYLGVLEIDASEQLSSLRSVVHGSTVEDVTLLLNVEATHLFSASLEKVPAPPYESAWRDAGRQLAGPTTAEVARTYHSSGVAVNEDSGELLPDHIARELEFLGHTNRQRALALRAGDRPAADHWSGVADRFRDEHLTQWLPAWSDAVSDEGTSPFFASVALIATMLAECRVS